MRQPDFRNERLPSKGQINAITDIGALLTIRDAVEESTVHIEADLEFRTDEPWASRARAALAIHRLTERRLRRRLTALKAQTPKKAKDAPDPRAPEECDPLTVEALADRRAIDPQSLTSTAEVDAALHRLGERINAVTLDREDEITLAPGDRDEAFMAATGNCLRTLRGQRQALQIRRGEITRAARAATHAAGAQTREQLFIDAARAALDRGTYLGLWDRVDQMQAADTQAATAAEGASA